MANLLPGWYNQAYEKWWGKQQAMKAAAQAAFLNREMPSFIGWKDLGCEYTCIPDPAYPWRPELVKDIWKTDPSFRPTWVRWIFEDPQTGRKKIYGFHVLGRKVKDPHGELYPFPVTMPTMPYNGLSFDAPNFIERHWEGDDKVGDTPGSYLSFDSLYAFCKAAYRERSAAEVKEEFITKPAEAREKAAEAKAEEDEYILRDLRKYVDSKLAVVSEVEMKDRFLGERDKPTKPMVILGH